MAAEEEVDKLRKDKAELSAACHRWYHKYQEQDRLRSRADKARKEAEAGLSSLQRQRDDTIVRLRAERDRALNDNRALQAAVYKLETQRDQARAKLAAVNEDLANFSSTCHNVKLARIRAILEE